MSPQKKRVLVLSITETYTALRKMERANLELENALFYPPAIDTWAESCLAEDPPPAEDSPRGIFIKALLTAKKEGRVQWSTNEITDDRSWEGLNKLLTRNGFPALKPSSKEEFSCVTAAELIKEAGLELRVIFRPYS